MKYNFFLYLSIVLILVSCSKTEQLQYSCKENKTSFAVYSILSPMSDSIFVTIIPISYNIYEENITTHDNTQAKVVLSDSINQHQLSLVKEIPLVYGCAQKDFAIRKGRKYNLKIDIDGYEILKSCTTVPSHPITWGKNISFTKKFVSYKDTYEANKYYFKADYIGTISDNNYIGSHVQGIEYRHNKIHFDSLGNFDAVKSETDTVIITHPTSIALPNLQGKNTKRISLSNNETTCYLDGTQKIPKGKYLSISYFLYTVDNNLKAYYQLLKQYKNPTMNEYLFFEPRIDCILPSFSNIEGGYGLFGSYCYDSIHYDLRDYQDFHEND